MFRKLCENFSNKAVTLRLVKKDFTEQGTTSELIASREISISPSSVNFGELRKYTVEFPGKGFGFDKFVVNIELELAPKDLDKTLRPFETLPNKAHTCCQCVREVKTQLAQAQSHCEQSLAQKTQEH